MAADEGGNPPTVCLGKIVGAFGVKGEVRIRSFTEPPGNIAAYGALTAEPGGANIVILAVRAIKGGVAARLEGVGDRNAAERLKGKELHLARGRLPDPESEEFYHADLIGLVAEDGEGKEIGIVSGVFNFGAGDILEIRLAGDTDRVMVAFTRDVVPVVDTANRRLVISPPAGLFDNDGEVEA